MRRRALCAASMPSGGEVTFPATLVSSEFIDGENIPNYNIAKYFVDKYPNMVVGIGGFNYTPITEDVTISGSRSCDGKVLGVRKWSDSSDYLAVIFLTQRGISNLTGFKVVVNYGTDPKGSTGEVFID